MPEGETVVKVTPERAVLRDRSQVLVRPVRHPDAAAERTFIEALSPQTSRFCFLGQVRHPSSAMIEKFTDLDYVHDVAFAAVVHDVGKDRFVGVSRYNTTPDGTDCECAVTALDDWQNKGLGVMLMTHLIEVVQEPRHPAHVVGPLC